MQQRRSVSTESNRIVKLNVGGIKYLTTEATLVQSENFFTALLSGKIPSLRDEDGYYFIDRNGKLFEYLLEFLRSGRWRFPSAVDEADILAEANFYSIDLHLFSPLSDAALSSWMEQRQTSLVNKQWSKHPELELLRELICGAFRTEQRSGAGDFEFVFYPEVEGGSISAFIAKLIAEDDVSPEHRKVIEQCMGQLRQCDFHEHPYYPLSLNAWHVLGLPQCQTLLTQRLASTLQLSVDFKMSRIGVARVEKRQDQDGASLYRVHDFYALTGLEKPRSIPSSSAARSNVKTLRQQFDRCVTAIVCVWSFRQQGLKSPTLGRRPPAPGEEVFSLSGSPPLDRYQNL